MNELIAALEAMIRRVVQEEMKNTPVTVDDRDFVEGLKNFVDNKPAEFAALISQGAVDQPWFDNAIKAEIAMQPMTTTAPEGFLLQIDTKDKFRDLIREVVFDYYEDELDDHIRDRVQNMDFECSVSVS